MAKILDGKAVASKLREKQSENLEILKKSGRIPGLMTLRVGEEKDDIAYESSVKKRCEKLGINFFSTVLDKDIALSEFKNKIEEINADGGIDGVLPLSPGRKELSLAVSDMLDYKKDIDGFTDISMAGVFTNKKTGFPPCTARACMEILDFYDIDVARKAVTVIGRSLVVGKPLSMMLLNKDATVTVCHSKTENISEVASSSEILILAVGKAGFATEEFFSPGQTVIDVGTNYIDGKVYGDADFESAKRIVGAITPVPGGVGTVTTAVLLTQLIEAAMSKERS
ncbi:MAG: bifunctional 5,10-methylenetetrahydrofolate dehydrogenase/5,10-methenyltetrahydrofolate cyclohydrolase [Ruminococcaceae bacterium]|nr:bifunctional 5,10-methylenetetrahydrofolate dehydrogenase/5,10-methenyltetrahydrofolate cyclohydrolase [Oscillospiraceae bacterium]